MQAQTMTAQIAMSFVALMSALACVTSQVTEPKTCHDVKDLYRGGFCCGSESSVKLSLLEAFSAPTPPHQQGASIIIHKDTYRDKFEGFWVGLTAANWAGLITENIKLDFPFFTRHDWGKDVGINQTKNCACGMQIGPTLDYVNFVKGQSIPADDDTDIEYIYQHLLYTNKVSILSPEMIANGWLRHISYEIKSDNIVYPKQLFVSNRRAFRLMLDGIRPPDTSNPRLNEEYDMIDAQLTTEIFGLYAPGNPNVALRMAHLPIRTTARGNAAAISEFYVYMHSMAALFESSNMTIPSFIMYSAERAADSCLLPEMYSRKMYDYILSRFQSDPQPMWEDVRDETVYMFDKNRTSYDLGFFTGERDYTGRFKNTAGINFAMSLISLFWGKGDWKETVKIGTLTGYDSDNSATATWGGLLGFIMGKTAYEAMFGITISDQYDIAKTRSFNASDGVPHGIDKISEMAEKGIEITQRAITGLIKGTVVNQNTWQIPLEPALEYTERVEVVKEINATGYCFETETYTNLYGLTCSEMAAAGYCDYSEPGLWTNNPTYAGDGSSNGENCPHSCNWATCPCNEVATNTNIYGLNCVEMAAAGYCDYSEPGLWINNPSYARDGSSNGENCPHSCNWATCPCNEIATNTNLYGLNCVEMEAAGYCDYSEPGLWTNNPSYAGDGSSNGENCPHSCNWATCHCNEVATNTNIYGLNCVEMAAAGYCAYVEPGLWTNNPSYAGDGSSNGENCPATCRYSTCEP